MSKPKNILLIFALLISTLGFSQYTDVINSNRPGESMSAFSVGKTIFQAEIGAYYIKEKHDILLNESTGYGTDILARWGVFKEELEVDVNLQYQRTNYSSILINEKRNGFKKAIVGVKYLIYDPNKNYVEKVNLISWKANHRFKWRKLIPAVSVYAGANLNFSDNPFSYTVEPSVSPKIMVITQNQFPGSNVFVVNIFYDKISSLNPTMGYVMTYTKGFNDHWSAFLENKGVKSDYYSDGIFTAGAAYLFKKSMQIDASISSNYKNTPSILYGGIGMSWRFEKNYKEVRIKNIDKNKSSKGNKKDDKKTKKRKDEVPTPIAP